MRIDNLIKIIDTDFPVREVKETTKTIEFNTLNNKRYAVKKKVIRNFYKDKEYESRRKKILLTPLP